MEKKVTAISFENIKDEYNSHPVVRSMSTIAGTTSILIAAEYLSNERGGKGVMLGGIPGITHRRLSFWEQVLLPEYAVRAALGLGAHVKVFDSSVNRLNNCKSL